MAAGSRKASFRRSSEVLACDGSKCGLRVGGFAGFKTKMFSRLSKLNDAGPVLGPISPVCHGLQAAWHSAVGYREGYKTEYDLAHRMRIDMVRALALLTIFINHVPATLLERLPKSSGFGRDRDFMSGISIALAYGTRFVPSSATLTLRMWRRAGVLLCVLIRRHHGRHRAFLPRRSNAKASPNCFRRSTISGR